MPNWTSNTIEAEGISHLPLFDDEGNFDFNKIIPMPVELDLASGSTTGEAIIYFLTDHLTKRSPEIIEEFNKLFPRIIASAEENFENYWTCTLKNMETENHKADLYELGEKYVNNYRKYGFTDWYGWRLNNWGTKWNACDSFIVDDDVVDFDTAWSPPIRVIITLSKMYPELEFTFSYTNEDEQETTYFLRLRDGVIIEEFTYENEIEDYEEEEEPFEEEPFEEESFLEDLEEEIYIEESEELDSFLVYIEKGGEKRENEEN